MEGIERVIKYNWKNDQLITKYFITHYQMTKIITEQIME